MNTRTKIVLQNRESLLYLKANGQWTSQVDDAASFENVLDASSFAQRGHGAILDIVMRFGDPRYDVRLPASA